MPGRRRQHTCRHWPGLWPRPRHSALCSEPSTKRCRPAMSESRHSEAQPHSRVSSSPHCQRKNKTQERSPRNLSPQVDIRSALDFLSDAGGTVPAALSALDPAVISGLFELYGQKLADQGRGQYVARLPGALGFTAVHGTAAPFASRLWNLPERYARCDYCSVRVYAAGQITASGLPRKRGPCRNIMMWQRSLPVLYLHHSPA